MLYLANLKGERGDADSETVDEADISEEVKNTFYSLVFYALVFSSTANLVLRY